MFSLFFRRASRSFRRRIAGENTASFSAKIDFRRLLAAKLKLNFPLGINLLLDTDIGLLDEHPVSYKHIKMLAFSVENV